MSTVLRGSSWVVSFVPLLSLGFLTWPLFTVLAVRARSWPVAGAALGYLGLFALELWTFRTHETVFDISLFLLMVAGTTHAVLVRHLWFRRVWRRPAPVEADVMAVDYAMVSAGGVAPEPVLAEPVTVEEPVQRLLDEIDELVEQSMRDGEPQVGYDYDDPTYPDCPNPYCDEPWHGLAITTRMERMRTYGEVDLDYDYRDDDSSVLCPGSAFEGEWEQPSHEVTADRWESAPALPPPDPEPDPVVALRARADTLWTAVARPAVLIVVASWLLAMVSMFLAPAQWRWLTVVVGVMAPLWAGWVYGCEKRLFPDGYARKRLRARRSALAAVVLMVWGGWLPMRWAWEPPLDPAEGYFALVIACAVACLGHAVVQIGRVRPVAGASMEEMTETDPTAHGENLVVLGFGWMLFGLPITLLFGWILGYLAYQPGAMWAAVAVNAVLVLALFIESGAVKIMTKTREDGDLPMIVFLTIGVGALLVWSLLRIGATQFQP
ncbi:hypothetical protein [Nocardia rhizosphaerihabitans]|uniref:hypothetical protein n=1 Tax=Nocardia rhizosphaerihabitans TaxID=1691570 RepID=UPI001667FF12|nr:hypothetical protein [Nocardia rhizosphaerihabitans]